MTINLSAPELTELKPRIVVIGVGGAGGNAVNNMIDSGLQGVDFIIANTDSQSLALSKADRKIQLGTTITQGLGCGARPEIGREAARESLDEVLDHFSGAHMAFITAGMGGGTGTGAAPVIAEALREQGILTVGVVTKPFQFEGSKRSRLADAGIEELQQFVDTLIVIPNQNLFRLANEKTTFADAFGMADNVLHAGVRGITDLMVMPGLINLDFADVRTVMGEMGKAMMGTGEAEGEQRAVDAAEAAISNPLLDEVSMKGAQGLLINISGGMDLTLYEVDEAANRIREEVDPEANIIVGSALDESLNGMMRVSVVATGIDADGVVARPIPLPKLATSGGRRIKTEPATDIDELEIPEPTAGQKDPVNAARQPKPKRRQTALDVELPHGTDSVDDPAFSDAADEESAEEREILTDAPRISEIMARLRQARSSVPAPKPIEPEPAPLGAPETAKIPEAPADEPFIAPLAAEPDMAEAMLEADQSQIEATDPDEPAELAAANATGMAVEKEKPEQPAPAPKRRGLFGFPRRNTANRDPEERIAPKVEEPVTTVAAASEPVVTESIEEVPPTNSQLSMPEPDNAGIDGTGDEDLLEIPSFLRRRTS
jgi:cell division protein FtsZ